MNGLCFFFAFRSPEFIVFIMETCNDFVRRSIPIYLVCVRDKHREEILRCKSIRLGDLFISEDFYKSGRVRFEVFPEQGGEVFFETDIFKSKLDRLLITASKISYQASVRHAFGKLITSRFHI